MYGINLHTAFGDPVPMAGRVRDEYTATELQLVEHLRYLIGKCLRCREPSQPSVLADRFRNTPVKQLRLRDPDETYVTATSRRRKPDHGQWSNTTHAKETRARGRSRPLTESSMRYVRAIWELKPEHIDSIIARYSPDASRRRESSHRMMQRAASRYSNSATRQRSRIVTAVIVEGGQASEVRKALGLSPSDWRSSTARRMYYDISDWLERLDIESLLDWHGKWSASIRSA